MKNYIFLCGIFHFTLDFDHNLKTVISVKEFAQISWFTMIWSVKIYHLRVNLSEVHNSGLKINETFKMTSITQTDKY